MLSFRMSASDFEMLTAFMAKKARGSSVKLEAHQESRMTVTVKTNLDELAVITIYSEELSLFPTISKTVNLGEALD